jgi:protein-tyrosine-phosphatase
VSPGSPDTILFVCSGNTCRSPLAAALARAWVASRGLELEALSAGVSATDDAPASTGARVAARDAGLELEGHRAQLLTRPLILAARLVLTMGRQHRDFARVLAPEAADRIFVLREYATRGADTGDVRDPFGGDRSVYRRTLEELRPLVERGLQRWIAEAAGSRRGPRAGP